MKNNQSRDIRETGIHDECECNIKTKQFSLQIVAINAKEKVYNWKSAAIRVY